MAEQVIAANAVTYESKTARIETHGSMWQLWIDGVEIRHMTELTLELRVDDLPRLTFKTVDL